MLSRIALLCVLMFAVTGCRSLTWGCKRDGCHCADPEGTWCVYWIEADRPWARDRCEELNGIPDRGHCLTENVAGECVDVDSCHGPHYYFYDGYAGGYEGIADLEEAKFACEEGPGLAGGCPEWLEYE